jgi:hypothetical protein
MTILIERLRANEGCLQDVAALFIEAADEIEKLREALEFACPEDPFDGGDLPCCHCGIDPGSTHKSNCAWVIGRTALGYGPFTTL